MNFLKPHQIFTHSVHSDNCYFHFFNRLSDLVEFFVRFHEILFQTDAKKFQLFILKNKKVLFQKEKIFLGRCQYQNKKALFTDPIFSEGFGTAFETKINLSLANT